jgi:hypothetical protein
MVHYRRFLASWFTLLILFHREWSGLSQELAGIREE